MDVTQKQQTQIAELVKAKSGTVSPQLLAETEATSMETHHQQQIMKGLGPTKVCGAPTISHGALCVSTVLPCVSALQK